MWPPTLAAFCGSDSCPAKGDRQSQAEPETRNVLGGFDPRSPPRPRLRQSGRDHCHTAAINPGIMSHHSGEVASRQTPLLPPLPCLQLPSLASGLSMGSCVHCTYRGGLLWTLCQAECAPGRSCLHNQTRHSLRAVRGEPRLVSPLLFLPSECPGRETGAFGGGQRGCWKCCMEQVRQFHISHSNSRPGVRHRAT